jgi:hypothetical protein
MRRRCSAESAIPNRCRGKRRDGSIPRAPDVGDYSYALTCRATSAVEVVEGAGVVGFEVLADVDGEGALVDVVVVAEGEQVLEALARATVEKISEVLARSTPCSSGRLVYPGSIGMPLICTSLGQDALTEPLIDRRFLFPATASPRRFPVPRHRKSTAVSCSSPPQVHGDVNSGR